MREFIKRLRPGTKVIVVFSGFTGHLNPGAEYRDMLEALAARHDLDLTLILPNSWAYEYCITGIIGDAQQLGWRVVSNELVSYWPSQLLVSDENAYSGIFFDHNSIPTPYDADGAHRLWNFYTDYCKPGLADA